MTNYVVSTNPKNGTRNLSQVIRDEFELIQEAIATKSDVGGLSATSITSLLIELGTKTFTIEAGKEFVPGQIVFLAETSDPANLNMTGTLVSYNKTTGLMVANITSKTGSSTESSWYVGVSNSAGVTLATNSFTGAQNFARATVASHATTAGIWAANGNQIDFTGTATVTAFPAAPQAGAWRELICADACSFTAGTDLKIGGLATGATYTAQANDVILVRAITTTSFLLTIHRYDGKPSMVGVGHKLVLKGTNSGANGRGTTALRVLRFTTVVTNTGDGTDWTYTDSAANGGTITILKPGWYAMNLNVFTNGGYAGVTLDCTQLTATSFSSLANDSERIFWTGNTSASDTQPSSFFGYLPAGVLRVMDNNSVVTNVSSRFTLERVL